MTLSEQLKACIRTVPDFPKPGIHYKDISTLFLNPGLLEQSIVAIAEALRPYHLNAIAGIESRGFLFGATIALHLNLPFVMIRKAGKLPAETYKMAYDLEYGKAEIEMHKDAIQTGWRVGIIDDVLATGGTALAAVKLIEMAGAQVPVCSFLADIMELNGKEHFSSRNIVIQTLLSY